MRTTYKIPLTIKQQTDHIRDNKRVIFNNITEDDSHTLLYEHGYINLITPFKHRFAKKRKDGTTIRDVHHNHIYPTDIEFSDYYLAYNEERMKYPVIFSNIMRFESLFNSVVSYEIIHFYGILTYNDFLSFVQRLKLNAASMKASGQYSPLQIDKMLNEIDSFDKTMQRYEDIYIFMDRLSLSQIITVFRCSDPSLRSTIFKNLMCHNGTIGYKTFDSFDEALTRIVPIRNCVCHSNSLEVLTMYLKIKQKVLRTPTDRKKYKNLIRKLSLE